ncbi:Arv1-like family-domain-containing protein [Lactifluus subvellereus]|nr:Arv1-like family-domain-containing protein [Lactifluus subvellereus]
MPLCINCAQAVPYLYTVYHSVNNVRLEQCPSCRAPADPYVEHDTLVIVLDLILLKRGVYRHLLFNRRTPPRKVEETARGYDQLREQSAEEKRAEDSARERTRRWLILRVGAGVVLVDSCGHGVRSSSPMSDDRVAAAAFLRILLGSLIETASFYGGITLASSCVLTSLDRIARWRKLPNPPSSIRQQLRCAASLLLSLGGGNSFTEGPTKIRYSHIPLCLLYSSLTKFMLLVVLSIWGSQVKEDPPRPAYVYKMPFESPLWRLLDDDVLDRTWLVRNMLGGMSTGFGLRVVLDCHPVFTSLVILSGWGIKTGVVGLVRQFIGSGNVVEETWLAYSRVARGEKLTQPAAQ